MHYAPNIHRSSLHDRDLPDGPLTPRQRTLVDAVRGCLCLADFTAVEATRATGITVCWIAYDTPPEIAGAEVKRGLDRAQVELDRLRGVFAAYGAAAFTPQPHPVPTPKGGESRYAVLISVMRSLSSTGRVLIRAGDHRITRGPDGAYVLAEPVPTPATADAGAPQ
jgi:hypothetical protein